MAESVKRDYRSPQRSAAAAATRARIRAAATDAFVEDGYAATTLRGIARRAGVGERTLYDAFPGKAALFAHALNVAIVGDEAPVPVAERPEFRAAGAATDPAQAIAAVIQYSADLLDRAGDLIMVSVEAAGADRDMREAAAAGAAATHRNMLAFAEALDRRGVLAEGIVAAEAADILYGLLSPHMHQLLRRHRGWSTGRYRAWLERTLAAQLLGPHWR